MGKVEVDAIHCAWLLGRAIELARGRSVRLVLSKSGLGEAAIG